MNSVAPNWEISSHAQFKRAFAFSLVGSDAKADEFAFKCALVRTVLWALTRHTGPSHILRIKNVLLDLALGEAAIADEKDFRAQQQEVLDALADAGDVIELAGGRWHPAPVREIDLGGSGAGRLLVGGVPTSALPAELQENIRHAGASRRVTGDRLREVLALPLEHLGSWAGAPGPSLEKWAEDILGSSLSAYDEPKVSGGVRVYAPQNARRGAPQKARWSDRLDLVSGRFLADRPRIFGAREHRVIEVRQGKIVRSGSLLLRGEARRLMYAMDAIAGNAVNVGHEVAGDRLTLTLWSELPWAEVRLFSALGNLEVPPNRYYPRTWRFVGPAREVVLQRLVALRVRLVP